MTQPLTVIGHIRSAHVRASDTPVQAGLNRAEIGVLDMDPAYAEALDGLEGFDYVWLLTLLDNEPTREPAELRQVPFLLQQQGRPLGVFAMRGPRRPSPIGLSLVRIVDIDATTVRFAGVDMTDGTAVLDIKPYVTAFDSPPGHPRCGWFDEVDLPQRATPASLRPGLQDQRGQPPA